MIVALRLTLGNVSEAAKKASVDRKSHNNWMHNNDKYRETFEEIEERNLDLSESKLLINVNKGNQKAIQFHLERKGKKRGYGKELILGGDPDKPLKIKTLNDFYADSPSADT